MALVVHPVVHCCHNVRDANEVERVFQSAWQDLHAEAEHPRKALVRYMQVSRTTYHLAREPCFLYRFFDLHEGARKWALVDCMQNPMSLTTYQLAKDPTFCRLLQAAFETGVLSEPVTDQLVFNLLPHVRELANDPSGNYVLQKIIDLKSSATAELLVWRLQQVPLLLAKNRHSCRILERLIEQHPAILEKYGVVRSLLMHAEALSRHPFGNFVIQRLIMHVETCRKELFEMLKHHLWDHASHRTASHVLQCLLEHVNEACCRQLVEGLLEEGLEGLMTTRYGSFVVLQVVQSAYPGSDAVRNRVKANMDVLRESDWAMKNLVAELPHDFFQ